MIAQAYEYRGENLGGGVPSDDNAARVSARLNELGAEGWRLVAFTGGIAWFLRSKERQPTKGNQMSVVPVVIDGVLYPKGKSADDKPIPGVFVGNIAIAGLGVGGGPIVPPGEPPSAGPPGSPTFPIWGPPGSEFPGVPAFAGRFVPIDKVRDLYRRVRQSPAGFGLEGLLAEMRVELRVDAADAARIPPSGPVVVVANHPY